MPSDGIYLSFDDGPHPNSTPRLLELLDQFNMKATFFCSGKQVEKYFDLYTDIKAKGHSVGHHGYTHLSGWKTSTKHYLQDIEKASGLIGSSLFRPPYGKLKPQQYNILKKKFRIVFWDIMPGDFDQNIDKNKLYKNVLKHLNPGTIVVLHDTPQSLDKLEYLLNRIKDAGKFQAIPYQECGT